MIEELERLRDEALAQLGSLTDEAGAEAWRSEYLGRRSRLQETLRSIGSLPAEQRRQAGETANNLKRVLEAAYQERIEALRERAAEERARREQLDVTMPGRRPEVGQLHPVTQVLEEIERVFVRLGFEVVEGP